MTRARVRWPGVATVAALLATGAAGAAGACAPGAVRWHDERRESAMMLPGARLTLQPGDVPAVAPAWTALSAPGGPSACAGGASYARAGGDTAFAAWWAPRRDSTALLLVARTANGGRTWRAPVVADSADRGRSGCARPPPFVRADTSSGYVFVVYFMAAREGPGVFFTHSMEGGTMFHEPVPIVYGERASVAAVASSGDTVAVAYENPNAAVPQVWLALSRSMGHIFESRERVSPTTARATRPAVALRGGRIAVAWFETGRAGGTGATVVRLGSLRW